MIVTITNHVSKGLQCLSSPFEYFNWYKTNFNMPVPNIFAGSTFTRYIGPVNIINASTSYSLSGFTAGLEICVYLANWDFENNSASVYNISTQLYNRWTDPSLNTIFWGYNGATFTYSLPAFTWISVYNAINTGIAGWEVNANGTYHCRASCTGTPTQGTVDTSVTMSNVPSVSGVSSNTGSIWVEGNNLCFINAQTWKHTMVGTYTGTYAGTSKAGSIWVNNSNELCWIGANGYKYICAWHKQQFASVFSNSSTGSVYAGTSKAGTIWMDSEFGATHLAYIGADGYKYLTGAGDDPYN